MPQVTQLQRSGLRFKSKSDSEASASGSPPPAVSNYGSALTWAAFSPSVSTSID